MSLIVGGPRCEWCRAPTGVRRNRPIRFCDNPEPGKGSICRARHRSANKTPEEKAKHAACQRRYMRGDGVRDQKRAQQRKYSSRPEIMAAHAARERVRRAKPEVKAYHRERDKNRKRTVTPEQRERNAARKRERRIERGAEYRELHNRHNATYRARSKNRSAAREGDVLKKIDALVPKHYERDTRQEMVAEAAILMLEGVSIKEAVERARKKVTREADKLRYAKPIEDAFWL